MREVIVVGAGPVGMMLACELKLLDVDVLLIERLPQPSGLSKALGIAGRTVELFEMRGLLPRIQDAAARAGAARLFGLAHFGSVPLDFSKLPEGAPPHVHILQAGLEAVLEQRLAELGVEVQRGVEVKSLAALQARYIVGCDGGRSTVRRLAGIAFEGTEPTMLLRLGDVKVPEEYLGAPIAWKNGKPPLIPLDNGWLRLVTRAPYPAGFDHHAPMELADLSESAGIPLLEARWLSRFTNASRLASTYRKGNVLLAGDAAHIHLPAGGPGLNLGFNDAVNLGWKLAAVVQGRAGEELLDTYEAERRPAAERVIAHTRAQGQLFESPPLRQIFAELIQEPAALRRVVQILFSLDGDFLPVPMPRPTGALVERRGEEVLIRPDGYVAWRSSSGASGVSRSEALQRWFGGAVP